MSVSARPVDVKEGFRINLARLRRSGTEGTQRCADCEKFHSVSAHSSIYCHLSKDLLTD